MRKLLFQSWCNRATSGIHVSPDREIVSRELFDHMEDHYQSLIAQGISEGDAKAQTVAAMGNPDALAPMLAAEHPPFWTRLLHFLRRALLILCCVTLLMFGFYILETEFFDPVRQSFNPAGEPNISGETQLLSSGEPGVRTVSDGYTLTIDYAAHWRRTYPSTNGETLTRDYLNLQVTARTPIPWASAPGHAQWFWAVDSLGNYYYSAYEDSLASEPAVAVENYHTGVFTYVHDFWLSPYVSQEAEWIELHYDRDGRSVILHLDLQGGDLQ